MFRKRLYKKFEQSTDVSLNESSTDSKNDESLQLVDQVRDVFKEMKGFEKFNSNVIVYIKKNVYPLIFLVGQFNSKYRNDPETKIYLLNILKQIASLNISIMRDLTKLKCDCKQDSPEYCVRCFVYKKKNYQKIQLHKRMTYAYLALKKKLHLRKEILQQIQEFIFDKKDENKTLQERQKKQVILKKRIFMF